MPEAKYKYSIKFDGRSNQCEIEFYDSRAAPKTIGMGCDVLYCTSEKALRLAFWPSPTAVTLDMLYAFTEAVKKHEDEIKAWFPKGAHAINGAI
jgi:hypothetical protein